MNLLESSHDNGIEIAYITETKQEYQELKDFFETYILPNQIKRSFSIETFVEVVNKDINEVVNRPGRKAYVNDEELRFNQHSGYKFFLENGKLKFNTWLNKRQLAYLDSKRELLIDLDNWKLDLDLKALSDRGKYLEGVYNEKHSTSSIHEISIEQANRYHQDIVHLIAKLETIHNAAMYESILLKGL